MVPTKSTLFGLDVRFRHVDQKVVDEKAARSVTRGGKNKNMRDADGKVKNRHLLPADIMRKVEPKEAKSMRGLSAL